MKQPPTSDSILFNRVNLFDGKSESLIKDINVLVEGNLISKISSDVIDAPGAMIIDAGSQRVMTPGFIDAHAHLILQLDMSQWLSADENYLAYISTQAAKYYLHNGFTTIRDAAGNTFSLKKAIDQGIVEGPRVYPSGPLISQTAGHADFRRDSHPSAQIARETVPFMKYGHLAVADGRAEVLVAVREALRRGATQIKIAVGGGTASYCDPLDVVQYTADEISAAVEAAADWGTYVMAHVYNPRGIRRAIDNGVKSIEHGNLVDQETLLYMKEKGVWLSPQVKVYTFYPVGYNSEQMKKHDLAFSGIDHMFKTAKEIGFDKIVFGTDIVTDLQKVKDTNQEFILRGQWFTPVEVLRQAISVGAELLALSGNRNPYPGKLGVIEEGALADLLLINGNPLENLAILTEPQKNIALVMKDGKIYKNIT